ncbi:MAG: hypothetical protein IPL21_12085 [Saprospirales bacterium]|nr:hypothetical protein [Saprospirales bacterium]
MKKKNLTLLLLLVTSIITVYSKNPEKLIGISLDNDKKKLPFQLLALAVLIKMILN